MTRIISYRIVSVDISASFLEHCHEIMVPTPYLDQSSNNRQVVIVVQATATLRPRSIIQPVKNETRNHKCERAVVGQISVVGQLSVALSDCQTADFCR